MNQRPGFSIVDEQQPAAPQPSQAPPGAAVRMLTIALGALAQRTLVALSSLFTLSTVASAWWLWWSILPAPSDRQLIALGLYAVFVLSANVIVRRK